METFELNMKLKAAREEKNTETPASGLQRVRVQCLAVEDNQPGAAGWRRMR